MKTTQWLWLTHTVVLIAESFEAAQVEYKRLMTEFPNNKLFLSTSGYDSNGKTYRAIFWRES